MDKLDLEAERIIYEQFKRRGCFDPASEVKELLEDLGSAGFIVARLQSLPQGEAPENDRIKWAMSIRNRLYELAGLSVEKRQAINDRADDIILSALPQAPQGTARSQEAGIADDLIERLGNLLPEPPEPGVDGLEKSIATLVRRYDEESREAERLRDILRSREEKACEESATQAGTGAPGVREEIAKMARDEHFRGEDLSKFWTWENLVPEHRARWLAFADRIIQAMPPDKQAQKEGAE